MLRARRRVSLSHTENLTLCVYPWWQRDEGSGLSHRIPYKMYTTQRYLFVYQHNKIALIFYSQSSIGLEYTQHTDPAYDSISSSLFTVRCRCRRSFQAATAVMRASIYFVLSFSPLPLPFANTHFMAPCKPIVSCSFPFIHSFCLFFRRFPLFPRISFSLPHSRTHSFSSRTHAVYAQNSLFIPSTIVCFSLLFPSRSVHTTNLFLHDIDIDMYTNANKTFYIRNCEQS